MFTVGIAWEGGVPAEYVEGTLGRILREHANYVNYVTEEVEVNYALISFTGQYDIKDPITTLRPHAKQLRDDFSVDEILFVLKAFEEDREGYYFSEEKFGIAKIVLLSHDLQSMVAKLNPTVLHELNHIYLYQISPALSIDLDVYRGTRQYKELWFEILPRREGADIR